ncbi:MULTISPECIES: C2 family cysteine protease [unclassified Methanoregula]|uniref:C2 family cysteine protease n=1 Tax=unclassified Methanoregula TaxID=2649730 RepID=UPI0009C5CCA6|nr:MULTISPECIES: C2 family cysteine protease [unclassified Methanoregula]OPX64526.1 MAG: Calpain family cysteine protease [Methanoregula sp. PtaB.Bin085]OPY37287.1 MAG: Calpain family cysteine protease [Methanoregula sp. PtaU1.Bin006]
MVGKKTDLFATGAINPYALVCSRKGSNIDWKSLDPAERKKIIEEELQLPFDQLFDPKNGSPLFPDITKADKNSPQSARTGDSVPRCSSAVSIWSVNNAGGFACPPPDINDVNQGCSLNCWFTAALASYAWTWPDLVKRSLVNNATCYLYLYKGDPAIIQPPYMPAAGVKFTPVRENDKTSYALPWGAKGPGDWVYCRPSTANPNAYWSALYEKCYADFYKLDGYEKDTPNIAKFDTGNPLNSLTHLTGKRYYTKLDYDNDKTQTQSAFNMTEFDPADTKGDTVFDTIYKRCYIVVSANNPAPFVPGMTLYPMTAWTYTTAEEANAANKVDPKINPEKSVKYTNDSIVARHSYSILGVHYVNNRKYIVLRNPWGMAIPSAFGGDPKFIAPAGSTQEDIIYYTQMGAALYTGTWTVPVNTENYTKTLNKTEIKIDLSLNDGIFALAVDKFRWHFKGFGWVWKS